MIMYLLILLTCDGELSAWVSFVSAYSMPGVAGATVQE
jgi:hypothetical protein